MDPQILWLAWCFETCFSIGRKQLLLKFFQEIHWKKMIQLKFGNLLECFINNYLGGGFKDLHFLPRMLGENDPTWQTFFWKWVVQPPTMVIPLFLNRKCTLSFFLYFTRCTLVKKNAQRWPQLIGILEYMGPMTWSNFCCRFFSFRFGIPQTPTTWEVYILYVS